MNYHKKDFLIKCILLVLSTFCLGFIIYLFFFSDYSNYWFIPDDNEIDINPLIMTDKEVQQYICDTLPSKCLVLYQ